MKQELAKLFVGHQLSLFHLRPILLISIFCLMTLLTSPSQAQIFHCVRAKSEGKCGFLAFGAGYEAQGLKFEETSSNGSGEIFRSAPRFSLYLSAKLKSSHFVLQYTSAGLNLEQPENFGFTNPHGQITSAHIGWGRNTKFWSFLFLAGSTQHPLVSTIDFINRRLTVIAPHQTTVGISVAKGLFALKKLEVGAQLDLNYLQGQKSLQVAAGTQYSLGLRSLYPLKRGSIFSLVNIVSVNQLVGASQNTASQTGFQLGYSF